MDASVHTLEEINFQRAYDFMMAKLQKQIAPHLLYHCAGHTKDVVDAVQYLSKREKISEPDAELLQAAALFHDTGFLKCYDNHEEASCNIARCILPDFGYSDVQVEEICGLIMKTKMPQTPASQLEEIICDADLFYLGSEDYFEKAERLQHELKSVKKIRTGNDWYKMQTEFLKKHHYFTLTAIKELEQKKSENLRKLQLDMRY